ncbi:NAD(P)-dependent dehydrogenase (short-subunit alcohol dehydrogenase family) [Streptosporangium becharense]|uniref:NAD(P)-dependent dehydrogenase (Short-subunit alcohol dehydrogenase family) n=1 Tax=Streptosporangium becharense TaxID=1816182 RepID=A0A7W9MID9_9ACTN|nr:SDR family oxidoreductase [Streptosporangium becharense]MBB2911052.1 NAD(P)-dependent dehydrogenase (short-subunit alcohol dehydrogenase family) [Streptosporangium becharense]MBB5821890.1 NAD(P)-dependent dehydrogenase (short-subunit alcohol dehydrogenase family) [Streptosporangium becharense]
MKTIVVTGGSRGIGLGLVRSLLARGHRVALCGSRADTVREAAAGLDVLALVADVTDRAQLQTLWDAAADRYGRVDIWVNNAGVSHTRAPLWRLPEEEARSVVAVNLLGALNGSAVALAGMAAQGGGHLWNMEGLGSDGRTVPGLSVYGATKRALTFLTRSLVKEVPPGVSAGLLSPGMVVTDLLTLGYDPGEMERARKVFDILADRVETVTPWLAERVVTHARNGAHVRWLTPAKVAARFAAAPFRRRDVFGG